MSPGRSVTKTRCFELGGPAAKVGWLKWARVWRWTPCCGFAPTEPAPPAPVATSAATTLVAPSTATIAAARDTPPPLPGSMARQYRASLLRGGTVVTCPRAQESEHACSRREGHSEQCRGLQPGAPGQRRPDGVTGARLRRRLLDAQGGLGQGAFDDRLRVRGGRERGGRADPLHRPRGRRRRGRRDTRGRRQRLAGCGGRVRPPIGQMLVREVA